MNYLVQASSLSMTNSIPKIINFIILEQLIVLPFMILEWNPVFVIFNRILFYIAGGLAIISLLNKRFKSHPFSVPYIFVVLVLYAVYGLSGADNYHNLFYESILNGVMVIMGAALIFWSINAGLINFPKYLSIILIVHSADVVFQAIFGSNVLGFEPAISGRNWGMFVYGAPSSGVFISMLFFFPWFWLRGLKRVSVYGLIITALFLSNDRGPIIQIFSIIFAYGLVYRFKLALFLTLCIVVMLHSFNISYEYFPYRVEILFKLLVHVMEFGVKDLVAEYSGDVYSIQAYVAKYLAIYHGWFNVDNWFHLVFGTGIGVTSVILEQYTGIGRPHSNVLEFFMTFGLFFSIYFLIVLFIVIKRSKNISIVLMPALFPFSFYSMYSFNWFILFVSVAVAFNYICRVRKSISISSYSSCLLSQPRNHLN